MRSEGGVWLRLIPYIQVFGGVEVRNGTLLRFLQIDTVTQVIGLEYKNTYLLTLIHIVRQES